MGGFFLEGGQVGGGWVGGVRVDVKREVKFCEYKKKSFFFLGGGVRSGGRGVRGGGGHRVDVNKKLIFL